MTHFWILMYYADLYLGKTNQNSQESSKKNNNEPKSIMVFLSIMFELQR